MGPTLTQKEEIKNKQTKEDKKVQPLDLQNTEKEQPKFLLSEENSKKGELKAEDQEKEKITPGETKNTRGKENNSLMRKRKFTTKIITGSQIEGNDQVIEQIPEYHQSEEEIKVRRSFLAYEKKKNRDKKKEEKKFSEKKEEKHKEEETEEDKDEDDENEENKKEEKKRNKKKPLPEDDEEDNGDTQSSITSSSGSTMRSFYSLRAAIDEKFIPLSIRNMSCSAVIVFILLLAIASNLCFNFHSCILCNAGNFIWTNQYECSNHQLFRKKIILPY